MLAFATYFLYSYIAFPVAYKSVTLIYSKRYEICPLVRCLRPLSNCIREPSCQAWLNEVAECSDETSPARRRSAQTFAHVQHPEDPAYCQYQSFDSLESATALEFLECIGCSGCLKPADFTDTCANLSDMSNSVMSIEATVPPDVLQGTWKKLYTTGWDLWPCQWTEFWPPNDKNPNRHRDMPAPDPWMKSWPDAADVWRMDLYWKNGVDAPFTFHMNNEMYLSQTWNFSSSASSSTYALPVVDATLKTRAVMWGTEAHENWYLLDYHPEWQTMLIYYCAHTEAVDRFDSMAMVLQKQQGNTVEDGKDGGASGPLLFSPVITKEQATYFERRARELLGEYHGNLQRIPSCNEAGDY